MSPAGSPGARGNIAHRKLIGCEGLVTAHHICPRTKATATNGNEAPLRHSWLMALLVSVWTRKTANVLQPAETSLAKWAFSKVPTSPLTEAVGDWETGGAIWVTLDRRSRFAPVESPRVERQGIKNIRRLVITIPQGQRSNRCLPRGPARRSDKEGRRRWTDRSARHPSMDCRGKPGPPLRRYRGFRP